MTKRHLLFNPWLDRDDRLSGEPLREPFLQPTGRANMVWVYQGGMLGRYDTKKFEFVESFWVPTEVISNGKRHQSLQVDSGAVWVDEVGKKVYIIDRGCLVSLPLPDKLHRHKAGSRETEGYGGVRGQGTGSTLDTLGVRPLAPRNAQSPLPCVERRLDLRLIARARNVFSHP